MFQFRKFFHVQKLRTHFRNDKNPVIQRALKVLEDSKSGHLVATREVVFYDNFRKDVERSEARKRKIRKELAKLEQGELRRMDQN